jgi:hypothetical protein
VSLRARGSIYRLFLRVCQPLATSRILDVGATADDSRPESNFLERWYPHPERITALGDEELGTTPSRFPGVSAVQGHGQRLPFADGVFDIAFSNAVVEHVGHREAQREFVRELSRVARQCFISTPNRGFPIETHTGLPLVHFLPDPLFRRALRALGKHEIAHPRALHLLWRRDFLALAPPGRSVQLHDVSLAGVVSNLVLHLTADDQA